MAEVDWVVTTPCPTEPVASVRRQTRLVPLGQPERDFASQRMSYDLEHRKWVTVNKKCLVVIKNTIEPAIVGSIPECDRVTKYLDRKKSNGDGDPDLPSGDGNYRCGGE